MGATAGCLGLVHGPVGVADQTRRVDHTRGSDGDPQAGGQRHPDAGDQEGLAQCLRDPDGDVVCVLGVCEILEEQDELVAGEARQGVAGAEQSGEAPSNLYQQQVSCLVSEGVVEGLEAVQVDEQHPERPSGSEGAVRRMLQTVLQHQPVRQAGQGVAQGELLVTGRLHLGLGPRRGVEQVRRGDVGQRLRGSPVTLVQIAGGVPVQVEGTQPWALAVPEREGEDRREALRHGCRREQGVAGVGAQVGDGHGCS